MRFDDTAKLIEHLGGLTKAAELFGIPGKVTTVQGWKERGRLPLRQMPQHEAVLRRLGIEPARTLWFPEEAPAALEAS